MLLYVPDCMDERTRSETESLLRLLARKLGRPRLWSLIRSMVDNCADVDAALERLDASRSAVRGLLLIGRYSLYARPRKAHCISI